MESAPKAKIYEKKTGFNPIEKSAIKCVVKSKSEYEKVMSALGDVHPLSTIVFKNNNVLMYRICKNSYYTPLMKKDLVVKRLYIAPEKFYCLRSELLSLILAAKKQQYEKIIFYVYDEQKRQKLLELGFLPYGKYSVVTMNLQEFHPDLIYNLQYREYYNHLVSDINSRLVFYSLSIEKRARILCLIRLAISQEYEFEIYQLYVAIDEMRSSIMSINSIRELFSLARLTFLELMKKEREERERKLYVHVTKEYGNHYYIGKFEFNGEMIDVYELLSDEAFFNEGEKLHHCLSYTRLYISKLYNLQSRTFSLEVQGRSVLTTELSIPSNQIIQMKGRGNIDYTVTKYRDIEPLLLPMLSRSSSPVYNTSLRIQRK
jgi:hypothetical protein